MERYKLYLRHIIPFFIVMISIVVLLISVNTDTSLTYYYDDVYDGYFVNTARGNAKTYTIPELHNGKKVYGIGDKAFFNHSDLEEVIFEKKENIKVIGRLSFSECPNLKLIDLSAVQTVGRNAFAYDSSLDNINYAGKDILVSTFYQCTSLKNITLTNVKTIGALAFSYTKVEELTLPKAISTVYEDAFKYSSISSVNVPKGFTSTYLKELGITINYYE